MGRIKVRIAKQVMCLSQTHPTEPYLAIGGLSETFQHPAFTRATEADRERIMHASSQSRYEDENAFPWDNYFGQSVKPWATGELLDLGCFTGGRTVAWWERYGPRSISGVDVNDIFIEAARRFADSRGVPADFRTGFGESLPWPDGSFDAILTFDVLEHVQSVTDTLTECWRVLRPGGYLLAVFPSYFQPIEHHLGFVTNMPGVQYMFSGRTLVQAYSEIIEERGAGAGWYGRDGSLASWERCNTINGMTAHRFARLIRQQDWRVELNPLLPIGSVGRRAKGTKGKLLAAVFGPLTQAPVLREVAVHRITYILAKPKPRE